MLGRNLIVVEELGEDGPGLFNWDFSVVLEEVPLKVADLSFGQVEEVFSEVVLEVASVDDLLSLKAAVEGLQNALKSPLPRKQKHFLLQNR